MKTKEELMALADAYAENYSNVLPTVDNRTALSAALDEWEAEIAKKEKSAQLLASFIDKMRLNTSAEIHGLMAERDAAIAERDALKSLVERFAKSVPIDLNEVDEVLKGADK